MPTHPLAARLLRSVLRASSASRWRPRPTLTRLATCAVLFAVAVRTPLHAQDGPIPALAPAGRAGGAWITFEGTHFRVHARREFAEWATRNARQLDSVRGRVLAAIGTPATQRVTVLVDDPRNVANGNAISWLDAPQITLYPVPPDPRSQIGRSRDWAELLLVHEYAHVAHLAQPRRGPGGWLRWMPGRTGPVGDTPRWVKEGYATLIEGRLTGTGRPHSPLRAAVLREWAVRGRLPTYAGLDGGPGWQDGGFAYLAGSAFLECLQAAHGDSALPQLWRRLTARRERGFATAFEETFGVRPDDAWARYAANLVADAIALERAVDSLGQVVGRLEARLGRGTDDPAISPDGAFVALSPVTPSSAVRPLVVWSTDTSSDAERDSARRVADERRLRRDSLDPPSVPRIARGREARFTLKPTAGAPYTRPRWFASGEQLLVIRADVLADGAVRPDVFAWTPRTGDVRRITHGASVREAEPLAGDSIAVGTRCLAGQCDLVRIRLQDGAVTTLLAGDAVTQYARPRGAPDGRTVVAAEQWNGRWRPVLVDVASGARRTLGDDVSYDRYDATFSRDGRALLYVSEADGTPQLVRHALDDHRVTTLTRTFSAAFAPEPFPGDSALYFVRLDAAGEELRRLPIAASGVAALPDALARRLADAGLGAIITQPFLGAAPPLSPNTPVTPRRFGLGTQRVSLLPLGVASLDGGSVGGSIGTSDAVGRFGWLAMGLASTDARSERGGSLRTTWRGPVLGIGSVIEAEAVRASMAMGTARAPARGEGLTRRDVHAETQARFSGGTLALTMARDGLRGRSAVRVGAALHEVHLNAPMRGALRPAIGINIAPEVLAAAERTHLFVDVQRTHTLRRGTRTLALDLRGHSSRSAGGPTLGTGTYGMAPDVIDVRVPAADPVRRHVGRAEVTLRLGGPLQLSWHGIAGTVDRTASPGEAFALGGMPSLLVGGTALPQRVPVPWLAAGELLAHDVVLHTVRVPAFGTGGNLFASAVRGGDRCQRAAGIDVRIATLAEPFYRLPGIDASGGVAYLLDGPDRDRVRVWAGVSFRP